MNNKPRQTLRRERLLLSIGIMASVLAGFLLNAFSKTTHNTLLSWLGTAAFCIAIILAIVVLPMLMRKHERSGDKEPDERW